MHCPKCSEDVADGDSFCEKCGTALRDDAVAAPPLSPEPKPPVATPEPDASDRCICGRGVEDITPDGDCAGCGVQRIVNGKLVVQVKTEQSDLLPKTLGNEEYSEQVLSNKLAVVSHIGVNTHHSNQDFGLVDEFVVGAKNFKVAVVCDGLSTALNSALAAKQACQAFAAKVKQILVDGGKDPVEAVRLGIEAAQAAVLTVPFEEFSSFDPPESTIVAVLTENDRLATFGWVGDSRGYVLKKEAGILSGKPITRDHSWVNQEVDLGRLTIEEALQRPESSLVLRSLGPLRPGETFKPSFNAVSLDGALAVLLCCDGIHKYVDPFAGRLSGYWHEINWPTAPTALNLAKSFVGYANFCGGGDNNTAAIIICDPAKIIIPPTAAK